MVYFVLWSVLWPLALLLTAAGLSYPVWAFALNRLRLTDWLGYMSTIATILLTQFRLAEVSPWWLAGTPMALLLGILPARATGKRYIEDPHFQPQGCFVVGHPPERVKDWPNWPRSGQKDAGSSQESHVPPLNQ
jgi:hypothetical protein